MRIGNVAGRASLIVGKGAIDIEKASDGVFSAAMGELFERWGDFVTWARGNRFSTAPAPFDERALGAPSPAPRQVFAVGLNYRDHALGEAGLKELPRSPAVFTKFPTCIAGPYDDLSLPSDNVDWEVELVAVIGTRADRVTVDEALGHVAGYAVGQDFSERVVQLAGGMPQFSLGKSFPGFGPFGPWLVTLDELAASEALAIECRVNGERVQASDTAQLIFPVRDLVSRLSHVCPLLPGDVIFTGTPAGVGNARTPKWFLKPGDEVVSAIAGIGAIRQTCVGRLEGGREVEFPAAS